MTSETEKNPAGGKSLLVKASVAAALCATLFAGVKYLLPVLAPFICAALCAALIGKPLAALRSAAEKGKIGKKPADILVVVSATAALLALLSLVFAVCFILLSQLRSFAAGIIAGRDEIYKKAYETAERVSPYLGYLIRDGEAAADFTERLVSSVLSAALSFVAGKLPYVAGRAVTALPELLLSVSVFVLSFFSFCYGGADAKKAAARLPRGWKAFIRELRLSLKSGTLAYLRACLLLALMTFAMLYAGLTVSGCGYALLMSLITALLDALPAVGCGIILLPWGICCLLLGDTGKGIGILVTFAAVSVARRIAEPRIVGAGYGIPLPLSLFFMYAGYRCSGISGMILIPFLAGIMINLYKKYSSEGVI